jgi:branched-chain amino acid transport system substrate-binding protein
MFPTKRGYRNNNFLGGYNTKGCLFVLILISSKYGKKINIKMFLNFLLFNNDTDTRGINMKTKVFSIGIFLFFIGSLLPSNIFAANTIKIGVNAPLTGFAAADGKSSLNGVKLAVSQINAAGGVLGKQLELVVYDDQASPKHSVPIATKLIEKDNVTLSISASYSGASRAAAGIYQAAKVPYIAAYAVHPEITKAGDYVFRTNMMGVVQGRGGAKLVGEILKKKTAVVIRLNNDFGVSVANGFVEKAAQYGVKILNDYSYSIKDRRFGSIIAKVKADNPEAIYATGYFFTAGPLVSQIRAAGIKVPIIGIDGFDSQNFIEIAQKAAEGVIITTSLNRDSQEPATKNFIEEFEQKFDHKVDMVASTGHTAMQMAAEAIKKAGSLDKAAIKDALFQINIMSSSGQVSFNKLGELIKDIQVQVVRGAHFHYHSIIHDPVLLAPPEK